MFSLEKELARAAAEKMKEVKEYVTCSEEYKKRAQLARTALDTKPDLSALKQLQTRIKAAKRAVKLAQITVS